MLVYFLLNPMSGQTSETDCRLKNNNKKDLYNISFEPIVFRLNQAISNKNKIKIDINLYLNEDFY